MPNGEKKFTVTICASLGACVCACERSCERACVRICVRAFVRVSISGHMRERETGGTKSIDRHTRGPRSKIDRHKPGESKGEKSDIEKW